jgi:hypothetical protein
MKYFFLKSKKDGFAMLFTVLIVTLILSIAISISNLAFKQTILSSLAKDSQISFYQADTAVECGLYYDTNLNIFPAGTGSSPVNEIYCGDDMYTLDIAQSYTDYFIFNQTVADNSKPCSSVTFDKATTLGVNIVSGRGYNMCGTNPRQVERSLEVRY